MQGKASPGTFVLESPGGMVMVVRSDGGTCTRQRSAPQTRGRLRCRAEGGGQAWPAGAPAHTFMGPCADPPPLNAFRTGDNRVHLMA